MSGSATGSAQTTKATESEVEKANESPENQPKPAASLEEDDEFEDFPVEDWTQEDAEVPGGNAHLWEESWDDDDINEDFSAQLKEEMKKVGEDKRS